MVNRPDSEKVTLGEVHRLLMSMDERHSSKLDAIEQQARLTNGRTSKLEARVDGHDRDLHEVKAAAALPPEVTEVLTALKAVRMFKGLMVMMWVTGGAIIAAIFWLVKNVRVSP